MVKVIMGLKGSGKTKKLIELVKEADANEHGNVVCIEKDRSLHTIFLTPCVLSQHRIILLKTMMLLRASSPACTQVITI